MVLKEIKGILTFIWSYLKDMMQFRLICNGNLCLICFTVKIKRPRAEDFSSAGSADDNYASHVSCVVELKKKQNNNQRWNSHAK